MKRKFFTILSALSLLLLVAISVLWVRSYDRPGLVRAGYWNFRPHPGAPEYQDADMLLALHYRGGWQVSVVQKSCVGYMNRHPAGPGEDGRRWGFCLPGEWDWDEVQKWCWGFTSQPRARLGFRHGSGRNHYAVQFPDWATAAPAAVLPASWLAGFIRRRRARSRVRAGLCAACGYDLRASPGRCPECGRAAESAIA